MAGATDIRIEMKRLLVAAGIVPAGRVRDTPTTKWEDLEGDEIPCIGVYSQGTSPQRISQTSQKYKATYRVAVQVVCEVHDESKEPDELDAELGALMDSHEARVLDAVLGAPTSLKHIDWSDSMKGSSLVDRRRGTVVVMFDVQAPESYTPAATRTLDTTRTTVDLVRDGASRPETGWVAETGGAS